MADLLDHKFIDLYATDPSIPSKLRGLIEAVPNFLIAKKDLSNPNAVIQSLSKSMFDILIGQPGKILLIWELSLNNLA